METAIRAALERNWGWIVLRGVVAVLFGALAIARPGITLVALVFTWGAYAIADGIIALIAAVQVRRQGAPLWPWLLAGALGIVAGVLTFLAPEITALALLMVIASWAVGIGILQIGAAIRLRKILAGDWALGLSGVLSLLFGVLALLRPGAGALSVLWTIAAYAIAFGLALIVTGVRLKSLGTRELARA